MTPERLEKRTEVLQSELARLWLDHDRLYVQVEKLEARFDKVVAALIAFAQKLS
ncbi:MAG: hypothetical protein WB780_24470 [Candidatus Acidiferrales bacterium]